MNALTLISSVVAALCLHFIVRRWVVVNIYAQLIAAEINSPQRLKWVERLLARRDHIEHEQQAYKEGTEEYAKLEKQWDKVNVELGEQDPMCGYGRREQCLLETAWEIYHECGWRTRRIRVDPLDEAAAELARFCEKKSGGKQ